MSPPKSWVRTVYVASAVVLVSGGAIFFWGGAGPAAAAVATISRGEVVGRVVATGPVQASEEVFLAARVPGVVDEMTVKEGARVAKGQVVARIAPGPFQVALAETESRLAAQQSQLAQLERRAKVAEEQAAEKLRAAQQRILVARGQSAERQLAADRLLYEAQYALGKVAAQVKVQPDSAELQAELGHARQVLQMAQFDVDRLKADDNPARLQERLAEIDYREVQASIRAAAVLPEELQAARSAVTVADQVRARAADELANAVITAPFDGVVLQVHLRKGAALTPGAPILSVMATDKAVVMANVNEADVPLLSEGQKVKISSPAVEGISLAGKVSRIQPRAVKDAANATVVPVEIEFQNDGNVLRPGMSADVLIEVARRTAVVKVPLSFLRGKGTERYLFVLEGDVARRRIVTVGVQDGVDGELRSGLKEGERVITGPESLLKGLKDGERVTAGGKP